MKLIIILCLIMMPTLARANAVIFSGNDVKTLKNNIDLFGRSKVMGLNVDPRAGGGVAAPLGSLGMDYLTGKVYFKSGAPDTSWVSIDEGIAATSGTPFLFAGFDSSGILSPISQWAFDADGKSSASVTITPSDIAGSNFISINERVATITPTTNLINDTYNTHRRVTNLGGGNDFDFVNADRIEINKTGGGSVTGLEGISLSSSHSGSGVVSSRSLINLSSNQSSSATDTNFNVLNYFGTFDGSLQNFRGVQISPSINDGASYLGFIYSNPEINNLVTNLNYLELNGYGSSGAVSLNFLTSSPSFTTDSYRGLVLGTSGGVTSSMIGVQVGPGAGSTIPSLIGLQVSPQRAITNLEGVTLSSGGNGTSATTVNTTIGHNFDSAIGHNVFINGNVDDVKGFQISGTGTVESLVGLQANMTGFTVTPTLSNPLGRAYIIRGSGGGIETFNIFKTIDSFPGLVDSGNILATEFVIDSSAPISGTDFLGNNFSGTLLANDDHTPSAFGIGWSAVGLVGQISVANTKTVPQASFMVAGGAVPASSTGGTINNLTHYKSMGIAPAGGTLTITNMYGFKHENALGFSPVNEWGVHIKGSNTENFMERLAINTTNEKTTNASVGLEIGGTDKALRLPVLTTTQRNALTPLEGMLIYNSTTEELNYRDSTSWVTPSGGGGSPPTVFGSNASPRNITTTGLTEALGHMSTTALEQVVFVKASSGYALVDYDSDAARIEDHTVIGARMTIMAGDGADDDLLRFVINSRQMDMNPLTTLTLMWDGARWREVSRMEQ